MEVSNETAAASPGARASSPASPPPNCAICLGTCTNKCFSNSCMHQFCFTCLLEWSKIKPECPLCKQTFKSIIHNVKSINEYDEHFIPLPEEQPQAERNEYLYEYLPPAPSRHQFHFRTTFTVDPGGELAIQQMLLSHPLTNVMYMPEYNNLSGTRFHRRRRDTSATSFRRSIYAQNLWVFSPPDITARYRDCSPYFYSANPAARGRLVPWLNRELNALLCENTQQVMHLVDVILEHLLHYHIRSRRFKNILYPYLGSKTEHFVHEFYNFMRSPFDMIGYDRHVIYTDRPHALIDLDTEIDNGEDSDVTVISSTNNINNNNNITPVRNMSNPLNRPTLEVIEINSESSHDSDVIIQEPPTPPVVDLVNSDSVDDVEVTTTLQQARSNCSSASQSNETGANGGSYSQRRPLFPLKIRLKSNGRDSREKSRTGRNKRRRHARRSSSSSSTSSSTSSSSSSTTTTTSSSSSSSSSRNSGRRSRFGDSYERGRCKVKRKYKRGSKREEVKTRCKNNEKRRRTNSSSWREPQHSFSSSSTNNNNSDYEDNIPLSQLTKKQHNDYEQLRNPNNNKEGAAGASRLHDDKIWTVVRTKEENSENSSSSTSRRISKSRRGHYDEWRDPAEILSSSALQHEHRANCESGAPEKRYDFNSTNANATNTQVDTEDIYNFKEESGDNFVEKQPNVHDPRPGTSGGRLRSIILKKESDLWYLRPRSFSPDSSD